MRLAAPSLTGAFATIWIVSLVLVARSPPPRSNRTPPSTRTSALPGHLRAGSSPVSAFSHWTNLSSKRAAGGETLAEPGDAGVHRAPVVLEPDFCVVDRAGTRAALA